MKLFLDEQDLEISFNTAALMLGEKTSVECKFHDYAGLKATAALKENKILVKASRGFRSSSNEVLVGLALGLLSKLFYKKIPESAENYLLDYKQFVNRESVSRLHDALRERRGRKGKIVSKGKFFDLQASLNKIITVYPEVLNALPTPEITWSSGESRRVLAFYDSAFNKIVVNKKLDRAGVPEHVVDYLVFHELLHIKHPTTYHDESLRRCVHSREFKQEEKKFYAFDLASGWLEKS